MLALRVERRSETLILLSYGAVQHPIGVQRYFALFSQKKKIFAPRLTEGRRAPSDSGQGLGMRVGPAENQAETKHGFWRKLVDKSPLFRMVIGWVCLIIGLLGIILPIIPGIPFLIIGLALLSTEHRWVRSLLVWTKRRLGPWWPRKIRIPPLRRRSSRRDDKAQ